ncbi:MAG TPA: polysaccharide deacetylase family protein [Sulfuricurvum sp.]|nr:polysaccharide deacetylase family protein [Sulfuricurvum sp.]
MKLKRSFLIQSLLIALSFSSSLFAAKDISVLCYHRFGTEVKDSMTVTNANFESHLKFLKEHGYTVIALDTAERFLRGEIKSIPDKAVVITVDDGHKSVYTDMAPIVKKYNVPVTLFIYPSAISNAKYAMTWDQLRALESSKLFNIGSHMLWHPNFKQEKKKLSKEEYEKFADNQLIKSKSVLEKKMGHEVKHLAWAYGIYDADLEQRALKAGYSIALTIDRRPANKGEFMMAQPRYLMVNGDNVKRFEAVVTNRSKTINVAMK